MTDIVASIFSLKNNHGILVPELGIVYEEKDLDIQWHVNCGGTRAYLVRIGNDLKDKINEQAPDSHFMIKRVTSALFLSGFGLFETKAVGRLAFFNVNDKGFEFSSDLDLKNTERSTAPDKITNFEDWYKFICNNNLFRRAADDMYMALSFPLEADFFIYRSMEWLIKATNSNWEKLAKLIGISYNDLKKFKRYVNHDLGQRHGIESGLRARASSIDTASLVADLLHGFLNARKTIDPSYKGLSPEETADIINIAMPSNPYP